MSRNDKIYRILLFIFSTIIIVYLLPKEDRFKYNFQEGKPWRYGLLTAPFDFPIYKNQEIVKQEHDSVMLMYVPYFKIDKTITETQIVKLRSSLEETHLNNKQKTEIEALLRSVYDNGIIGSAESSKLEKEKINSIMVIRDNVAKEQLTSELRTARTAYEKILEKSPNESSRKILKSLNLNNYLTENLFFDKTMSEKVKTELLQQISASAGMVQGGEKIVDRGEIISSSTYNILQSLETTLVKRSKTADKLNLTYGGQLIIILSLIGSLFLFIALFRPDVFSKTKNLIFILIMIISMVIISSGIGNSRLLSIYLIPFAIVPIVIRTFLDSRIALFSHIITVMICSFIAPFSFEFLFLQLMAGMTSVYSLKDLTERSQLVRCAIFIFLTYSINYVGYTLSLNGDINKINLSMFLYFVGNCIFLLFTYLLIYLLEKIFGFISHVTLVELSNINSPLLRKFSEVCPGTFQHSLQVSNLATEAAIKIGANGPLVRAGALYHDIGKMQNPAFFTENQSGVNPHQNLTNEQSAQIVIQHVEDGLKIAKKQVLPQSVIDFISTHHGRGLAKYFYTKFLNQSRDQKIDLSVFSYPGPNPTTKEQGILMMADSVEAASRSLSDYSEESITKLVESIINSQIKEGLLKETPLSFKDMELIKGVFIDKLKIMFHTRISYPELKKTGINQEDN